MLPAWMIEELKRQQQEREVASQVPLYVPQPTMPYWPEEEKD
jgi:hypothetical protein